MVEIVWEFVVKEDTRGQFELLFGPGGAWSKFFSQCPGFRGTTLLRDAKNPLRYLTVEFWDSEAQRAQTLANRQFEYASLETAFIDWTETRNEVGVFTVRAEATVRSRGKTRRSSRHRTR